MYTVRAYSCFVMFKYVSMLYSDPTYVYHSNDWDNHVIAQVPANML